MYELYEILRALDIAPSKVKKTHKIKKTRKMERAIYDGPVRAQQAPFFEVRSKGTMIEYTDKYVEAWDAFRSAPLPREIIKVNVVAGRGFRTVIERLGEIRHLSAQEAAQRGVNVVQVA